MASLLVAASVGLCALSSLSPLASLHCCRCLCLFVVICVSLVLTVSFCRRHWFLVGVVGVSSSLLASCCQRYIAHVCRRCPSSWRLLLSAFHCHCWQYVIISNGSIPSLGCFYRLRRLVIVVIVGVLSPVSSLRCLHFLIVSGISLPWLLLDSRCRCRHFVVIVGV